MAEAGERITAQDWDRLPEETNQAYSAFMTYLSLGLGRSLAGAYRSAQGEKQGITGRASKTHRQAASHWEGWSSRHCWQERALAYDRSQRLLTDTEARASLKARLLDYASRMESQGRVFEQFIQGAQSILLPQLVRLTTEPEAMSARDMMYSLGKMSQIIETWQMLEGNALRLPEIIALFNEKED